MALTKVPSNLDATVAITQSASDNSTNVATTAYVTTAIANLVDGAPGTLNTLDEIAAALNDDAALNTTLTNSIATKLPLAGGTLTGALVVTGDANPALEVSRGSANTTNVNLKYNTTLTGQLSAADEKFQISAAGSGTEMEFYVNGSKRLEINTSGQLFVGDGSPQWPTGTLGNSAGRHMFHHNGESMIVLWDESTAAQGNAAYFLLGGKPVGSGNYFSGGRIAGKVENGSNAAGEMILETTNTSGGLAPVLTLNSSQNAIFSGNVGIGISTGLDRNLHIKGSNSDVGIQIEKDGVGELRVAYDSTGPYLYAENTNHGLRVYAGNAVRFKIDPDGAIDNVDSPRFVSTKNSTEHQFVVTFSHGTAYQHVDLILENTWWGSLEVHLTGTYSNQNMSGLLAKRFGLGLNNNNSQYTNESSTIASIGNTAANFHIGEVVWDATLGKYKVTISHLNANGNLLHIKVLAYSAESTTLHDKAQNFTVSGVYTSGSTYPKQQYENPAFLAYLSASQTISNSGYTKVAFNQETYDFGGNHSNGTFTAPERGIYQFGVNFLIYPHTSGIVNPQWWKQNSAYSNVVQQGYANQSHTAVNSTIAAFLNRNETFDFRVAGSSINSGAVVYGSQSYWYGYKVGGF